MAHSIRISKFMSLQSEIWTTPGHSMEDADKKAKQFIKANALLMDIEVVKFETMKLRKVDDEQSYEQWITSILFVNHGITERTKQNIKDYENNCI